MKLGTSLLASAAVLLAPGGCSVVVDADLAQCRTTDDCVARGDAFRDSVCDARRMCVPRVPCDTNQACTDAAGGAPSLCRKSDHRCVQVVTEDCGQIVGELGAGDPIVLGSILPLTGTLGEVGVPVQRSLELALKELNDVGGIPAPGSERRRPLALLACDEAKDGARAAAHLANDLEVAAIVGPWSSGVALKVGPRITVPAGTLMLSPGATAPSLSRISGGKLVWRTAASDAHQARALTQLIPLVEAEQRVAWEIPDPPEGNVRVAMIVRGDSYGAELAQATIESGLSFNGRTLAANGSLFARRDYPDPATTPDVDYASVVSFLVEFQPNLVILLTGSEGASEIVVPLEAGWKPGVAKPWYVLAHGARTPSLLSVAKQDDDVRRRMRGTMAGRTSPQREAFELAYRGAYHAPADVYGMAQAYDAAYLLAYGMVAGGAPGTGRSIGEGLKRTSAGAEVSAGPGVRIADAFGVLAGGGSIHFKGASGTYRFDPETGESPFDVDVWCIGRDDGGAPAFQPTTQYLDVSLGKLVGNFTCK